MARKRRRATTPTDTTIIPPEEATEAASLPPEDTEEDFTPTEPLEVSGEEVEAVESVSVCRVNLVGVNPMTFLCPEGTNGHVAYAAFCLHKGVTGSEHTPEITMGTCPKNSPIIEALCPDAADIVN